MFAGPTYYAKRTWTVAVVILAISATVRPAWAGDVYPTSLTADAAQHPEDPFDVIVIAGADADLKRILQTQAKEVPSQFFTLIPAAAISVRGREIATLAADPAIALVWRVPEDDFQTYVNILRGIEYSVQKGLVVLNISLGMPPQDGSFDLREPFNQISKAAYDRGHIVVLAAGNYGPDQGSISRWCTPWVACVGASNKAGSDVWINSSRAGANPANQLTVVAPGVDILTTHPANIPKTPDEIAAEKRIGFDKLVPPDKRAEYTVVTGTSFSTPYVTRIASLLVYFLVHRIDACEREHRLTFDIVYDRPLNREPDPRTEVERLVGVVRHVGAKRVITYPATGSSALVLQMLMDMAVGIKNYDSRQIGAGFVSWDNAVHYFGSYGIPKINIDSVKVVQANQSRQVNRGVRGDLRLLIAP
jgi:hypothetical protein